jgi:hypothetical protein
MIVSAVCHTELSPFGNVRVNEVYSFVEDFLGSPEGYPKILWKFPQYNSQPSLKKMPGLDSYKLV